MLCYCNPRRANRVVKIKMTFSASKSQNFEKNYKIIRQLDDFATKGSTFIHVFGIYHRILAIIKSVKLILKHPVDMALLTEAQDHSLLVVARSEG